MKTSWTFMIASRSEPPSSSCAEDRSLICEQPHRLTCGCSARPAQRSRGYPRLILILIRNRRNARAQLGDAVALDLGRPLRVYRLGDADRGEIQLQIGHEQPFAVLAEGGARRKQQAARYAVLADAVEVAELGDRLAGGVDHHDLVRLVGRDPD